MAECKRSYKYRMSWAADAESCHVISYVLGVQTLSTAINKYGVISANPNMVKGKIYISDYGDSPSELSLKVREQCIAAGFPSVHWRMSIPA